MGPLCFGPPCPFAPCNSPPPILAYVNYLHNLEIHGNDTKANNKIYLHPQNKI